MVFFSDSKDDHWRVTPVALALWYEALAYKRALSDQEASEEKKREESDGEEGEDEQEGAEQQEAEDEADAHEDDHGGEDGEEESDVSDEGNPGGTFKLTAMQGTHRPDCTALSCPFKLQNWL